MTQALQSTDPVLAESRGGYFKSKLRMFQGRAELTARQLIWYQASMWLQMLGFIGALLSLRPKKRTFELDLANITGLAHGKFALAKNLLDVTMADGTTYRFQFAKFDEFTGELKSQLAKLGRPLEIAAAAAS